METRFEAMRIAPIEEPYPTDVAEDFEAIMPPGVPPLALFRAIARNPRILRKVRLGNLLDRGSLDRRDRELVILRSTAVCDAEYEWGVHVSIFARRFGLSDEQIESTVRGGPQDPVWCDRDRALLHLVDELHRDARITDETWSALTEHWQHDQLVELITLTGFYHLVSFLANGLRVPLEEAAERFPPAAG